MSEDRGESVFSRWSRRKLAVKQEEESLQEPIEVAKLEAGSESPLAEVPVEAEAEAPPLTDADMPDIETLTEESDFSPFMSPGVSDELRKLALRKLFRASVFNVRDGLDEYDDDFTTFEKLGDIVTSDMKHRIEMEEKKRREKLEQPADDEIEDIDDMEDIEDEVESQVAEAGDAEAETGGQTPDKKPEEFTDEQS